MAARSLTASHWLHALGRNGEPQSLQNLAPTGLLCLQNGHGEEAMGISLRASQGQVSHARIALWQALVVFLRKQRHLAYAEIQETQPTRLAHDVV